MDDESGESTEPAEEGGDDSTVLRVCFCGWVV